MNTGYTKPEPEKQPTAREKRLTAKAIAIGTAEFLELMVAGIDKNLDFVMLSDISVKRAIRALRDAAAAIKE